MSRLPPHETPRRTALKPRFLLITCCLIVLPARAIPAGSSRFLPAVLALEPGAESVQMPADCSGEPCDATTALAAGCLIVGSVLRARCDMEPPTRLETKDIRAPVAPDIKPDDPAIRRALQILQQPVDPIRVVTPEEARAICATYGKTPSPMMMAFRAPGVASDPNIYINSKSEAYRKTGRGDSLALLQLAATLAHEQVHGTEGGVEGERAARRIEADFIRSKLKSVHPAQRKDAERHLRSVELFTR